MKKFTRFFALMIMAVMVLGLAGCAKDSKVEATPVPVVVTEVPATEVPATEVPATEVPATEVPATEVPATEVPATEVPATEVPATEAPATEVPATEAPATEVPATEAPATEAPATEVPAPAAVTNYADYVAAALDTPVEVETYVQAKQSWWDNKGTFYTQNEEGAYFIYEMALSEEDYNKLVPGTKILVKGYKAEWAGEVEIVDATFEILEGEYIATPKVVTSLLGSEELINYQNQLVSFNNVKIEKIEYKNGEPGDDIYVTISYDGNNYDFCVERYLTGPETEVYQTVGNLHAGDMVDIEGFLYWYNGVNTHITKVTLISCAEEAAAETVEAVEETVAAVEEAVEEAAAETVEAVEETVAAVEEAVTEEVAVVEEAVAETVEAVEEVAAVTNYADYVAAALDTPVEVETYVQAKQSWWDNKGTFYTQNEEGAYFIYEMALSEEDYNKLVPGTKILVKGYKAEWAGEVEIVDATFEILEGEYIAEAKDLTDKLGTEELINYQNQLAAFKGMTVEAIEYKNGEPGDDIYVTLSLNGQKYDFCVERYLTGPETEVYTAVGGLHAGDVVDVEGFVYWYNGVNTHITKVAVVSCTAE